MRQGVPVRFEVLARTMVEFVDAGADADHIATTVTMIASVAATQAIDEVCLDMRHTVHVNAALLGVVRDGAARLDDAGVVMRVRRPSRQLREALRVAGLCVLIEGF